MQRVTIVRFREAVPTTDDSMVKGSLVGSMGAKAGRIEVESGTQVWIHGNTKSVQVPWGNVTSLLWEEVEDEPKPQVAEPDRADEPGDRPKGPGRGKSKGKATK